MCIRLFAAVAGEAAQIDALAFRAGLDVRARSTRADGVHLIELAWGDCACALATSIDGGARVADFARPLVQAGARVQLLLVDEREEPRFEGGRVPALPLEALVERGLSALEQDVAAELS